MTDWSKLIRVGAGLAEEYNRSGTAPTNEAIMWALLCDAAKVSSLAYSAPPRQDYPSKSTMPDAPDEITVWQKISAYLKGDLDEMPQDDARPPRPSAEAISRAETVLHVWHHAVKIGRQHKRAVYIRACGGKPGLASRITGLGTSEQKAAKRRAMNEMLRFAKLA